MLMLQLVELRQHLIDSKKNVGNLLFIRFMLKKCGERFNAISGFPSMHSGGSR
jgi:hypothetical protein